MRFDLIIPARNEAANIQDALRRLVLTLNIQHSIFNYELRITNYESGIREEDDLGPSRVRLESDKRGIDWRIIVAVNGTTDDTIRQVEQLRISNYELRGRVIAIECPGTGKGAAIRYAAKQCLVPSALYHEKHVPVSNGKIPDEAQFTRYKVLDTRHKALGTRYEDAIFGFIDADLSADPDMIPELVTIVARGEADIAIGSRLLQTKTTNRGWLRTLSSRFFNFMAWLFLGLKVKDAQCGLKVMNARGRDLLATCQEEGWFLDIEFLAKAVQDGLKVVEMPVPWIEFRYAGRKSQIRYIKDGWEMLKALRRIRGRLRAQGTRY